MSRCAVGRTLLRGAAVSLVLLIAGPALAQQDADVIGTIDATIDGEPHQWYQIALPDDDGPTPMSTWSNLFGAVHDVSLQGFREPRFMLDGTLALSLSLSGGLPEGCPCRYDSFTASVLYLADGSMTENLYVSDDGGDAVVTIEVFEPIGEGTYRVEGSFEATLVYRSTVTARPDLDRTVQIAGTFVTERLPEETTP